MVVMIHEGGDEDHDDDHDDNHEDDHDDDFDDNGVNHVEYSMHASRSDNHVMMVKLTILMIKNPNWSE